MSNTITFTSKATIPQGPISRDMYPALIALSQLVPHLPDSCVLDGRRQVSSLFDCLTRVERLEDVAIIPQEALGGAS